MKKWKLTYELCTHFTKPVTDHSFSLRCFPMERIFQRVQSCQYEITPCSERGVSTDSFGNIILTGYCKEPHEWFLVSVNATVLRECGEESGLKSDWQLGMYRYPSKLTQMGKRLEAFYQALPKPEGEDVWERVKEIMNQLYGAFQYQSGSTSFQTGAEEAFAQGCGVCQDYAHILLALCRRERMTARYVAGAIPGEGQSHAWIEVWDHGKWKGFDPTGQKETDEDYICFAVGRDAHDCSLNQGVFLGNALQTQHIYVKMEE